jgi:hypothetical protein
MRKMLVFLLIVGILIGTISLGEVAFDGESPRECVDFSGDIAFEDNFGDAAPCGGGSGGSGGGMPG